MKKVSNFFNKNVLREIPEKEFFENQAEIISTCGEGAWLRGKHYFEENNRVQKAYDSLLNNNIVGLLEMMNESGLSSYHQLKNCYVSSEEENLPKALRKVKEIDPSCYSRVHGGGFAGTMLMIVDKKKLKEVLPVLQETFGTKNVMKVSLVEYGTSVFKEENGKYIYF